MIFKKEKIGIPVDEADLQIAIVELMVKKLKSGKISFETFHKYKYVIIGLALGKIDINILKKDIIKFAKKEKIK